MFEYVEVFCLFKFIKGLGFCHICLDQYKTTQSDLSCFGKRTLKSWIGDFSLLEYYFPELFQNFFQIIKVLMINVLKDI